MSWRRGFRTGRPLTVAEKSDELAWLDGALAACRTLAAALTPLHQAGLLWLNFDPEALEVADAGVRLTNLDLHLFHAGACPDSLRLSAAYSPPEVCGFRGDRIGPATDVFHVCTYLYYRLADLLPGGFPGQGLEAFDFDIPPLRIYAPHLPVGVSAILERGLSRDPAQRYRNMGELVEALTDAVERAHRRHGATGAVALEWGSATTAGRTHELQGLPNQDSHAVVATEADWLAIVADGVTHARVGSGDVASQTAVEVLAATLPSALRDAVTDQQRDEALIKGCLKASRAILEKALEAIPPGECDPVDLMSSTVVIGTVRGNVLTLASAGDSRAYLIADGRAEQLTVDGDVRCTQLAAGAAPEEVRDMGPDASALYTCLGVGEETAEGGLTACVRRGTPHISRWRLLPGDIVVLCSDGLVEEGVFLEPAYLPLLLADSAGQSASERASRLVAAARLLHRDPSAWEPGGCGDDITCVVLVVGPGNGKGEADASPSQ